MVMGCTSVADMHMQAVEEVCRRVGRNARDWAQSVRSMEELADETGVEAMCACRRPMVVIKDEKRQRAR